MSAAVFTEEPLTEEDRVRRTLILCRHCLRNIAFYRAGWRPRRSKIRVDRQFWISANGSFMDSAILDWCKLFADAKGKHHWSKRVTDGAAFRTSLYRRLDCTEAAFTAYIEEFKQARDKFIAHLDELNVMYLPRLRMARASAAFLHDHLLTDLSTAHWFKYDGITPALEFYSNLYKEAVSEYRQAAKRKF